jgi:hypothetical protein
MKKNKVRRFAEQSEELRNASKDIVERFRLTQIKEEADVWGLRVSLQNDFAGVEFEFSPPQWPGWVAFVVRLVDGRFPKYPIYVDRHTVLNHFDIRDVAAIKLNLIPELADKIDGAAPLTASDICLILERCCDDIFQGDFSSFAELRNRVIARL